MAVVGGGQSAAEVTVDLRSRFPDASIDLIFRGHALKPSDSSPFVNEIFNPDYTDFIYRAAWRSDGTRSFATSGTRTMPSSIPICSINCIGCCTSSASAARQASSCIREARSRVWMRAVEGIEIGMVDKFGNGNRRSSYDAVILATGYDRETPHAFLEPIQRYIRGTALDRNYRLVDQPRVSTANPSPGIFGSLSRPERHVALRSGHALAGNRRIAAFDDFAPRAHRVEPLGGGSDQSPLCGGSKGIWHREYGRGGTCIDDHRIRRNREAERRGLE